MAGELWWKFGHHDVSIQVADKLMVKFSLARYPAPIAQSADRGFCFKEEPDAGVTAPGSLPWWGEAARMRWGPSAPPAD